MVSERENFDFLLMSRVEATPDEPETKERARLIVNACRHMVATFTEEHLVSYPEPEDLLGPRSLATVEYVVAIAEKDLAAIEARHAQVRRWTEGRS